MLVARLVHRLIQLLLVQTRLIEGVTAPAVRQGKLSGNSNILILDGFPTAPRRVRHRSPRNNKVRAHAIHVKAGTQVRNTRKVGGSQHRRQRPCRRNLRCDARVFRCPPLSKRVRIVFVVKAPPHDFRTNFHITRGCNINSETKAIKQLRAEFPFLRVHGAHQHKIGGTGVGNAVAFDGHGTGRGGVEKRIYQMVGQ